MFAKSTRQQRGFTLVEIAIVLVIIGLLLGGVLKGQEMIESARIKSVVSDMNGVSSAYNTYFDRYRAFPGDETTATLTARGWTGTSGGDADGVLEITLAQTFTNAGEQAAFWRSLRAAGLVAGDPLATTAAGLPRAGTSGLLGVTMSPLGLSGASICVSGLTTKQAAAMDIAIDGALPASNVGNDSGAFRAISGVGVLAPTAGTPAPATAYSETAVTDTWTGCRKL